MKKNNLLFITLRNFIIYQLHFFDKSFNICSGQSGLHKGKDDIKRWILLTLKILGGGGQKLPPVFSFAYHQKNLPYKLQ